jgi:hypothetical protein
MLYKKIDLTNITTAIKAYANGERRASVKIKNIEISYAKTSLDELIRLRDEIVRELSSKTSRVIHPISRLNP